MRQALTIVLCFPCDKFIIDSIILNSDKNIKVKVEVLNSGVESFGTGSGFLKQKIPKENSFYLFKGIRVKYRHVEVEISFRGCLLAVVVYHRRRVLIRSRVTF